jgi:hypothetical protein
MSPLPKSIPLIYLCPGGGCVRTQTTIDLTWNGPHIEGKCPSCRVHVRFIPRSSPGLPRDLEEPPPPPQPPQLGLFRK